LITITQITDYDIHLLQFGYATVRAACREHHTVNRMHIGFGRKDQDIDVWVDNIKMDLKEVGWAGVA
jgi:hypothetical protein